MSRAGITACVVVRNGVRSLPGTMEALLREGEGFDRIVLVDDASEDGTPEFVRSRYPDVEVVSLKANKGPAHARNVGFTLATTERILFVDADVQLDRGCTALLAAALDEHADAVMAMPRVLHADAPELVHFDGAHAHFLGLMALDHAGVPASEAESAVRDLGSIVTACFLLDVQRWGPGLPFDSALFFSYEDHDLGIRARMLGHRILAVPEARCFHGEGTPGLSVRGGAESPPQRLYTLVRNRWRIMLKVYRARTLLLLLPPLLAFEAVQLGAAVKKGWVREWIRAVAWSIGQLPATLRMRRDVQARRVVGDGDLLIGGPLPIRTGVATSRVEQAGVRSLERLSNGYWNTVRGLL